MAVTTAVVGFATRNLAIGFGCGITLHYGLRLMRWARARWTVLS